MMARLWRKLCGHGLREKKADEMFREHLATSEPEKRAIKARNAAVERLVHQLEKDAKAWH